MTKWPRNSLWRQGSLLTIDAIESLGLNQAGQSTTCAAILASHDCDIANETSTDPDLEVILGKDLDGKLDGNFTHSKNPRTLHISFEGSTNRFCEFNSSRKVSIPKSDLARFEPDESFSFDVESKVIFQQWLSSRYKRAAFSDEFESRLKYKNLHKKISKIMSRHGKDIIAIFFDVDDGKEVTHTDLNDCYCLDIILLYSTSNDAVDAARAANKAKSEIEDKFKASLFNTEDDQWNRIELRYVDVIADEALTYKQSTLLKKWKLDHLSLQSEPQQPTLDP